MVRILLILFALILAPPAFAATSTPNLGLVKPTPVPGSWAAELNKNFDILDTKFPGGFAESTYTINGNLYYCPDAGTDDAYVCDTPIARLAYINGSFIDFWPNTVNTLGATVNVGSLGVRPIVQHDGSVLTSGMLASGRPYRITYDAVIASFRMPPTGAGGIGAETDPLASAIIGILKSNGATLSAAVPNTDYAAAAHAARHQNGGPDEIATATAAANAIPKAGAGGTLSQGWIGTSMYDGSQSACVDAGSTDTYVCSKANPPTAYTPRMWIDLVPNTTSVGTASVNVNSLGAKSILKHDGTALADGDLVAGRSYRSTYDGTNFRLPPSGGAGGGTITGSGSANKLTKFVSASVIGDSLCSDDGTTISCGDVSGNHHQETRDAPSGTHVHNWKARSGDIAETTGTLIADNYPKFDSSGRLVDSGIAFGGKSDTSARVAHNATQSIPDSAETVAAFNAEQFDTATFHDNATNNSRLFFVAAGKYLVGGNIDFAANGTGTRYACLRLNATTAIVCETRTAVTTAGTGTRVGLQTLYSFAASDYIETIVFQDSGGALNLGTDTSQYPIMWAVKQ